MLRSFMRRVIFARPVPDTVTAKVVWVSSAVRPLTRHQPILRGADIGDYAAFVAHELSLSAEGHRDRAIAQRLTAEGFRSRRRAGVLTSMVGRSGGSMVRLR